MTKRPNSILAIIACAFLGGMGAAATTAAAQALEKIAFTSNGDQVICCSNYYEIYVMDADGSNQTRLTNNAQSQYSVYSESPPARNGPLRAYLSEHLLSVVQKTQLVFPIPRAETRKSAQAAAREPAQKFVSYFDF
ncbi:MAG: hypothetical protein ABGX04_00550 [Myxococcales bacterium]